MRSLSFDPYFHKRTSNGNWILREDRKMVGPQGKSAFALLAAVEECKHIKAEGGDIQPPPMPEINDLTRYRMKNSSTETI